ncbi:MAG: FHA domain-containing protein [Gemmataceae bacterium]
MDLVSQLPLAASPQAELVLENGRLPNQRRALPGAFTLIGQASGCQIRLQGDSIAPFHCAILLEHGVYLLRSLSPEADLRVNDQPVEAVHLNGGDRLSIGPYRFRFEAPPPPTAEVSTQVLAEVEATRIQVAAVMAQQAALTEQEIQLEQQMDHLRHHEEQLAAHLEARRNELETREAVLSSRERHLDHRLAELEAAETAFRENQATEQAELEVRQRVLMRARRRFRRQVVRWRQSCAQQRETLAQQLRQHELERQRLREWYEKVNGEQELRQRQLTEREQELALDQQTWEAALNEEESRRKRVVEELQAQHARLEAERTAFHQKQQQWLQYHEWLQRETKGLEARIAAQRKELAHHHAVSVPLPVVPLEWEQPAAAATNQEPPSWPETLQEVARLLDDQRAHLIEQWQQLLSVQEQWEQERSAAQLEIETLAQRLVEREHALNHIEHDLDSRRYELAQAWEILHKQQAALEAERAQFTLHEAETVTRLENLQAELMHQLEQAEAVKQRRDALRQRETACIQEWISRLEESRRRYSDLWMDCERLREKLIHGQDAPRTDDRAILREERQLLDERAAELARRESELAKQLCEFTKVEHRLGEPDAHREELRQLQMRYGLLQRELKQVREELERIVRALLDAPSAASSTAVAA